MAGEHAADAINGTSNNQLLQGWEDSIGVLGRDWKCGASRLWERANRECDCTVRLREMKTR